MELVKLEVSVPKEMQDVSILLQKVVLAIKQKKTAMQIAGEELTDLMNAISGADKITEEIKAPEAADCIALLGSGVYKALQAPAIPVMTTA